ncbi:MAG: hypothetical protein KDN22_28505 [Verrucomicrobiae bacterium]|nr:hypothetical protein [Verrucomicrobiae bacterium]
MSFEITERWLLEIAGWQVAKPAKSLASGGAVLKADFDGRVLRGLVMEGRKRLACGLKIASASDVTNLCGCQTARSTGAICTHSVAVGLVYSQQKVAAKARQPQVHSAELLAEASSKGDESDLVPVLGGNWIRDLKNGNLIVDWRGSAVGQPLARAGGAIATALKALGQTIVPERLTVKAVKAGALFNAITDHPGLTTGQRAIRVSTSNARLLIRIRSAGKGQVGLELMTKGEPVLLGEEQWWWSKGVGDSDAILTPLDVPLEFIGLITKRNLVAPESAFERLIEPFFDAFEESLDSDSSLISRCRGRTATPEVILKLEGSLRALDGWLQFAYPGGGPVVEFAADMARKFPYVDADGTRNRRNEEWEMRALADLRDCGFEFGRESLRISGEEKILRFLSSALPALKKRWKVVLGERFEHVSKSVSLVQPTIDWEEPRGAAGSSGEDWLEFAISYQTGEGDVIPPGEIQRMLRVGQSKLEQPNGKKAIVSLDGAEEWNATLAEAGAKMVGNRIRLRADQAAFVATSLQELGAAVPEGFVQSRIPFDIQISSELLKILREYQVDGVRWLAQRAGTHGGAILGDEMGLGKTLQTLVTLSGLEAASRSASGGAPAKFLGLVVCPASLLWSWEAEVAKFLPNFKTLVLHGTSRGKLFGKLNEYDIAITTYALAVRDLSRWAEIEVDALVLDEASYLRNPDTKMAKAIRALAESAGARIALTGTPIENGVKDLWSIMECVVPGYLGTRSDFRERYEKPLATTTGLSPLDLRRLTERLNRRIQPFFLRRTKSVVAKDLPSKIESVQLVGLTCTQTELYRRIAQEASEQMHDTAKTGNAGAARMHMLTALLRLRQVCCDPRLVLDQATEADSAKLSSLMELMDHLIEGGHSVLIFSQFVSMLGILRKNLEASGLDYCYLDGASSDRKEQVASFQGNRGKRAFLISLKAGGYGLNLTKADVVIHYDPWWNPAVEAQATDRAHRIGQTRPVTVYKLIARSSVEEKILRLQRQKRDVMDAALDDQQPMMRGLTDDDLAELLRPD